MKNLLLVVLAFLLVACVRSEEEKVRDKVIADCTRAGGAEDLCTCNYDKLSAKYSPEQFRQMERINGPVEGFMDDAMRAQQLCLTGDKRSLLEVEREAAASAMAAQVAANPGMEVAELSASASANPEAEIKAKYEAEWGHPMPEETLEDIRSRYESTDSILNLRYRDAMARLEPASQQQLKLRQREWLKERDQSCGTTDGQAVDKAGYECLITVVNQRIRVIENLH